MITSIHQSSLNMALRCGEQLRRRYFKNEIIPPSIAACRGTGVHAANKINLRQKIQTKSDLNMADIKDAIRDGYVEAVSKNGVFLSKEEQPAKKRLVNEGLEDALRCGELYRKEVSPKLNPLAVEEKFTVDVGLPLLLAGIIDYQEEPILGDLKTTSKTWPEGRIHQEIQPVLYSYVHEHEKKIRPRFTYHILVARRGKNGPTSEALQEQSMIPTDANYHALFAKLRMFCKIVETGTFIPANPTSWWCTEKWCGYYLTCPYVGNALPKKWI